MVGLFDRLLLVGLSFYTLAYINVAKYSVLNEKRRRIVYYDTPSSFFKQKPLYKRFYYNKNNERRTLWKDLKI